MPVVSTGYYPSGGDTLDVPALDAALYSDTPGDSILQTSNGFLGTDNLHASFTARKSNIRKDEAISCDSVGLGHVTDYYDQLQKDSNETTADFVHSIPGVSTTFRQRFHASVAQVNFNVFASCWRVGEIGYSSEPPFISTMLFVDGNAIEHTRRNMPVTVYWDSSVRFFISEAHSTRCKSQSHLIMGLTRGFHDIEVRVCMARQSAQVQGDRNYTSLLAAGDKHPDWGITSQTYNLHHRFRVGVRGMTVLRII
jgi:hypothetical protein